MLIFEIKNEFFKSFTKKKFFLPISDDFNVLPDRYFQANKFNGRFRV